MIEWRRISSSGRYVVVTVTIATSCFFLGVYLGGYRSPYVDHIVERQRRSVTEEKSFQDKFQDTVDNLWNLCQRLARIKQQEMPSSCSNPTSEYTQTFTTMRTSQGYTVQQTRQETASTERQETTREQPVTTRRQEPTREPPVTTSRQETPREHPDTTIRLETTTTTTTYGSTTTRANFEAKYLRLPSHLQPHHYDIIWRPDMYHEDPRDFWFNGSVRVYFHCLATTDTIFLNYRQLNIDGYSISVRNETDMKSINWKSSFDNSELERYQIVLNNYLKVGDKLSVYMQFNGYINYYTAGLFWNSFVENGVTRYLISTQFQATDARRAFPCIDDPAVKTTFSIATERQDQTNSYSNMPLQRTEYIGNNWWRDIFGTTTVPMSTYMITFTVAPYSSKLATTSDNKYEIRFLAESSLIRNGFLNFTSDTTPYLFSFFDSHFDFVYPLPKLDIIHIPGYYWGGMEHFGLITLQPNRILCDKDFTSTKEKQKIIELTGHEISHMWWGDIITNKWWDDIWMIEGMARYLQYEAVKSVDPTFDFEQVFVAQTLYELSFYTEDQGSLYSMKGHADQFKTIQDVDYVFNTMSYEKAASIIRMIKHTVINESLFKDSLREIIRLKSYGIIDNKDLRSAWNKIKLDSNLDIDHFLSTWEERLGYPVVNVTRNYNNPMRVIIRQTPYLPTQTSKRESYFWDIPLTYIIQTDLQSVRRVIFTKAEGVIENSRLTESSWILCNYMHYGYYRVMYDERNWNSLINQLNSNHRVIPAINRAQIISDSFSFTRSLIFGQLQVLKTTQYLDKEEEYLPWYVFQQVIQSLLKQYTTKSVYSQLQAYVRKLTNNYLMRFAHTSGEKVTERYRRNIILDLACRAQAEQCIRNALELFRRWKLNTNDYSFIHPDHRSTVACVGVANGDTSDWEFVLQKYKESRFHFSEEKRRLAEALVCSSNRDVLERLFTMAVNGEDIDYYDRYFILQQLAGSSTGRGIVWSKLTPSLFGRMEILSAISETMTSSADLSLIEEYVRNNPAWNDKERGVYEKVLTTVRMNVKLRESYEEKIIRWLNELGL